MYNDILGKRNKKREYIDVQCPECKKKYKVFGKLGELIQKGNKICATCTLKKIGKK